MTHQEQYRRSSRTHLIAIDAISYRNSEPELDQGPSDISIRNVFNC